MDYDPDDFDLPDSPKLTPFAPDIRLSQDEAPLEVDFYAGIFYGQSEFDGGAFQGSGSASRMEAIIADAIRQERGESTAAETEAVDDIAVGTTAVKNAVLETAEIAQFHFGADQGLDMAFISSQGNVLVTWHYRVLISFIDPASMSNQPSFYESMLIDPVFEDNDFQKQVSQALEEPSSMLFPGDPQAEVSLDPKEKRRMQDDENKEDQSRVKRLCVESKTLVDGPQDWAHTLLARSRPATKCAQCRRDHKMA
jgi:hypothetical protein